MLRFLSEAWVAELRRAAAGVDAGSTAIVIQHVVTGAPGATANEYWLAVDPAGVSYGVGARDDATVRYVAPFAIAAAVASGQRSPAEALMSGELRVSGRIDELVAATDVLVRVAQATARVRDRTAFA